MLPCLREPESRLVDQLHLCNFLKCWSLLQITDRVADNMLADLKETFSWQLCCCHSNLHALFAVTRIIAEEVAVSFSQWDPVNSS